MRGLKASAPNLSNKYAIKYSPSGMEFQSPSRRLFHAARPFSGAGPSTFPGSGPRPVAHFPPMTTAGRPKLSWFSFTRGASRKFRFRLGAPCPSRCFFDDFPALNDLLPRLKLRGKRYLVFYSLPHAFRKGKGSSSRTLILDGLALSFLAQFSGRHRTDI